MLALLDIREGIHFLDIGCGSGWAVGEVAGRAKFKGHFFGVDLSAKMIEQGTSKLGGLENVHFLCANAEAIPLDGDLFDSIICTNSFHHYLHPDAAVAEMRRLLRSGGRVYILDPTADSLMMKCVAWVSHVVDRSQTKLYSSEEFHRIFERAGLRYETSRPITPGSKVHIGVK